MNFILDLEQKQFIRTGIISEIGVNEFAVLLVIQSHTDIQQSLAFPSQQTIAELTGLSSKTVQRTVKNLEEKQLIDRQRTGKRGLTLYSIKTPSGTYNQPAEAKEESTIKFKNSKDFITEFCKLYFQSYGVNYNLSWARDTSLVKTKLMGSYTDEQLDAILNITFRDFGKKWANRQYPRPTIGSIAGFIANQALAIWQEEQRKQDKIAEGEEIDLDKYFRNQDF